MAWGRLAQARRGLVMGGRAGRFSTAALAHLEDAVSPLLTMPPPSLSLREQAQRASALSHPLLEARVQELVPGIDERGMHANRPLIFGARMEPAQDAVLMWSNDYLQLSGDPDVAAAKASALMNARARGRRHTDSHDGAADAHRAFERRVASLLGAQDAVLTMSGSHAVRGLLETICGARTPIYADARSWAAGAMRRDPNIQPFAHNDVGELRRLVTQPGVIVVDGVYTNGAVARLAEVVEVAEASGSVLIVDETHSFGVTPGGLGVCEEAGVVDRVHFRAIGLSKACASRGGVVVGPSRALEALRFVDRGLIFSTPPLEHEIIGYNATLDVLLRDEWRREKLHATHAVLQRGLLALGYDDDIARSERQILSIVTGDAARTAELRDFCAARGVFGSVFLPPFALDGRSFVRFTVHCGMSDAQCDRFLEVMEAARYIMK